MRCFFIVALVMLLSQAVVADLRYAVPTHRPTSIQSGAVSIGGSLQLLSFGFREIAQSGIVSETGSDLVMTILSPMDNTLQVAPALEGKLLNYPNPFRAGEGTTIGYSLSKHMDIEIKVFDMLGNSIASIQKPAGATGGRGGLNRISLRTEVGTLLSAGVYFYILMHQGKVLGRGKMAVVP